MISVFRNAEAVGIGSSIDESDFGPTVAFSCWNLHGQPIGCHHVQQLLHEASIVVRSGCCCNPGACAAILGHSDVDLQSLHARGVRCGGLVSVVDDQHVGVVRASLGAQTSDEDVASLLAAVQCVCQSAGRSGMPATSGAESGSNHAQFARTAKKLLVCRKLDDALDKPASCAVIAHYFLGDEWLRGSALAGCDGDVTVVAR
jgi:hypothetical protein